MQQQKPFVWTHTNLHCFGDTCEYRFFRTYIKKDIPYAETAAMREGNEGHAAFELRVGGGKPLPVTMAQWEPFAAALDGTGAKVELKLGVTKDGKPTGFFDRDVAGRGKADVVVIKGETAMLFDWKFGGSRYESPSELALHALMLKIANPYLVKINGAYVYVKEGRVSQSYDLSDFSSTWARTNNLVEKIHDRMASGEGPKKKGPLCGYCSVADCENQYDAKAGERR
jgi:hypothetical protein